MVIICGAANLYNDAICYALTRELNLTCEIVGSLKDLSEVFVPARGDGPSLLLIDGSSCRLDRVVSDLQASDPQTHGKLLLAVHNLSRSHRIPPGLLREWVSGLFYREDNLLRFFEGVRALLDGKEWLPHGVISEHTVDDSTEKVVVALDGAGLTHSEAEILVYVSRGETNEEIAQELCVSRRTVEHRLTNIYRKIDVDNRFQASLWVAQNVPYGRR